MKKKTQTFNDGILSVYSVANTAAKGRMPNETITIKEANLRFTKRVVGMTRFYLGLQSDAKIDKLLRCQLIKSVTTFDVVIVEGKQYKIKQIQEPPDMDPPCMDLSLELIEAKYNILHADKPTEESDPEELDPEVP